jgi:sulfur-oxidizing protein SoxZ
MAQTRIVMPARAQAGEIVTIKTLIQHPMETGFRRDDVGAPVPRDIIERVVVTLGGEEVFRATLYPGVAANPFLMFSVAATRTAELVFTWTDMNGRSTVEKRVLSVG